MAYARQRGAISPIRTTARTDSPAGWQKAGSWK
jgi:hypothetical protein